MTHRPFADQLASTFINARGEVCHNLDSSKSKVAQRIRQDRERRAARRAFVAETKAWRSEIVSVRKQIEGNRKEGLQLSGSARTAKFQTAADLEKRARELQKLIEASAKTHGV